MPWVEDGAGQRVAEDCRRLVERDAVLDEILAGLLTVPLEPPASSYDSSPQLRYRSDKRPNAHAEQPRRAHASQRTARLRCWATAPVQARHSNRNRWQITGVFSSNSHPSLAETRLK